MEGDHHVGVDQFRLMEKRVKNYCRSVAAVQSNMSKRQRLKAEQGRKAEETQFTWNEVIDVLSPACSIPCTSSGCDIRALSVGGSSCSESGGSAVQLFDLSAVSPGLFIVSQALSVEEQLHWASKAIEEYSKAVHNNLNNLSSLYGATKESASDFAATSTTEAPSSSSGTKSAVAAVPSVEDLWEKSSVEEPPFQTFAKLRWSCLGYHYDWTKRMYQRDLHSPFPPDLALLCTSLARAAALDLTVEAAIVNYYPAGTNMGGHLDDAEHTMEKPIISISLGLSAVFLIGGRTRNVAPTPILVRSGDAVIMSGESRYCYHGVPVILPGDFQPLEGDRAVNPSTSVRDNGADVHEKLGRNVSNMQPLVDYVRTQPGCTEGAHRVVRYLQQARINMNVRQVRVSGSGEEEWVDKCGTGAQS